MSPPGTVGVVGDAERAISNLLAEYAERIDAGDFDGVADLLAKAEVGAEGEAGSIRGREAVAGLYRATTRRYGDGTPRTRHLTSNLWLAVDEEAGTAEARSSFTVLQATEGLPLQPIVVGRYLDRFERHEGRWRFAERRFRTDLVGDVSRHLLPGAMSTRGERPAEYGGTP